MHLLSRRSLLSIAAVVDIALNARPHPVSSKALAARHDLPPRHLETMLQSLVRVGILKGVRGPRGGYEITRERRKITAGEIVRAVMMDDPDLDSMPSKPRSAMVEAVIDPVVAEASEAFLKKLDEWTIEHLCDRAQKAQSLAGDMPTVDFAI